MRSLTAGTRPAVSTAAFVRPGRRRVLPERFAAGRAGWVSIVGLGLVATVFAVCACRVVVERHHATSMWKQIHLPSGEIVLPADGAWHRAASVRLIGGVGPSEIALSGTPARWVSSAEGGTVLAVRSPVLTGDAEVEVGAAGRHRTVRLHFVADAEGSFGDGLPRSLHLHTAADRAAFRGWFSTLADSAAGIPVGKLPREIDDCAALVRWCYRNALHAHDEAWLETMPFAVLPPLASVMQYSYPNTPLGAALFRTRSGPYAEGDATDGAFAQFADARTLWQDNAFRVSRDVRRARPGDLLFFRQLEQNSPFHSMILTGADHDWAVYHTGPTPDGPGEVRRVAVADLTHHPDIRWRPLPENPNFLGVYRWNILHEDSQ